jgi:type I restriction enzyme R subunit
VGPPSSVPEDDEQAQRFDVVVLGLELVAVDGDVALGRLRRQVEQIATALSEPTRIPAVRSTAQPPRTSPERSPAGSPSSCVTTR